MIYRLTAPSVLREGIDPIEDFSVIVNIHARYFAAFIEEYGFLTKVRRFQRGSL
jgi:hypothetical protein